MITAVMISINYQSCGNAKFSLRLRLYQDGETKYISVNKLLKGKLLKRHWNAKKQQFTASAPFSDENNDILVQFKQKYGSPAKDGYIFPIRDKQKLATQTTDNGDIKHFVGRCNHWLKQLGEKIGCDFPLHCYTFRHTAITNYISKDVPVLYVANMMGTSVENCEKIYYNNQGDVASRNKVLGVTSF